MSDISLLSDKAKADLVRQAGVWWDLTGRHLVLPAINEYTPPPKVRSGKGLPIMVAKAATEKDLNDGILLARKWDELTPAEQVRVFDAWLHNKFIPEQLQ